MMDKERIKKLAADFDKLTRDERGALLAELFRALPDDHVGEPAAERLTPWKGRAMHVEPRGEKREAHRTLKFAFKRKSPVVLQLTFSKEDLGPVVSYADQIYEEKDGSYSLRLPIEPELLDENDPVVAVLYHHGKIVLREPLTITHKEFLELLTAGGSFFFPAAAVGLIIDEYVIETASGGVLASQRLEPGHTIHLEPGYMVVGTAVSTGSAKF